MKSYFNSKDEFLEAISGITNDGSVIINMKGDIPDVPKDKQFAFVEEAKKLDLEIAINNLPTTLRFELIKEGYEFLLDELNFDELDHPNDYWPGRMTSYILRKFPHLEPKVDWRKLKNNYLMMVLLDQPQFVSKIDFNKMNENTLADLVKRNPEYSAYIDFNRFNTPDSSFHWISILKKQPQFANKCAWSLISEIQKAELFANNPGLSISNK